MNTLQGKHVRLRALEPDDLPFLVSTENDESFWEISHTQTPFSVAILKNYLSNAHLDIYEAKQLRLIIEEHATSKAIGMIDLFDFNPQHLRAGVGIMIHRDFQQKGYGSEALELLVSYSFTHLNLHQLFANITSDNTHSIALFKKLGFKESGVKKDWIYSNNTFKDELLFQRIND